MNPGSDAAEQVVRMSLEGAEVAVRLTGAGAKNTAMLMAAVLKESGKTKGKSRLTSMLKSGKELKVYTVQQKDLKTFAQEAKRYGVLYCVLKDGRNKDPLADVDVITRAEDASKVQRITERFKLATVASATVITEEEKDRIAPVREEPVETVTKLEKYEDMEKPIQKEGNSVNPNSARTGTKDPLSGPNSENINRQKKSIGSTGTSKASSKPSVKEKLDNYRKEIQKMKEEVPAKVSIEVPFEVPVKKDAAR